MSTPYRLELVIQGLPKTTNSKRQFGHWAQYYREAMKWKNDLIPYLRTKRPTKPLEKAKLILIRASSQEPDFDGLVSSFKHVIDALTESGVIADDRMKNIGKPQYEWIYAPPGKGYLKVVVEEITVGTN